MCTFANKPGDKRKQIIYRCLCVTVINVLVVNYVCLRRHNNFRCSLHILRHEPLTSSVKLRFAHALGMPETFSPPPRISYPDVHHGTCLTHVPWCMPGSLTSVSFGSRWRGKHSRHSRRMRNMQFTQFYVSGKRPIVTYGNVLEMFNSSPKVFVWLNWTKGTASISRLFYWWAIIFLLGILQTIS